MFAAIETLDGRLLVTDVEKGPAGTEVLKGVIEEAIENGVEIKSYNDMVDDEELDQIFQSEEPYILIDVKMGVE